MDREEYMSAALTLAREAFDEGEIPVGCVITDAQGNIIGRGRNKREESHDATHHAEMEAIREACRTVGDWRLTGCTIYVTLEPCPMCAGAMVMSQLSACVYGAADARQGCCGSVYDLPGDAALSGVTAWRAGVLADECAEVMRGFFAKKRINS